MSNLKQIEAIFKGVFPKSKVIARRYASKRRTSSSTETLTPKEKSMATSNKEVIEGMITAISPEKKSIQVNDSWYRFSKANWDDQHQSITKNGMCRFEASSSESEYQGKTYTTNWANGFTPLDDIDDNAMEIPAGLDDLDEEPGTPAAEETVNVSVPVNGAGAKLVKALGINQTSLQIMVQTALKEVYTEKDKTATVETLADDIENAVVAMLITLYRLTK